MKLILASVAVLMFFSLAQAAEPPKTEEQKTLYAVGANIARSLYVFSLTPKELELVIQGLQETYSSPNKDFDINSYNVKIQEMARNRRKALGEKQAGAGKVYLAKSAKEKGAIKTDSGLVYIPITEGKGESPKPTDTVKVNYLGTLIDGKEFDSSYRRGKAMELKLDNVIKCWTEGVQKMKPGGKARLVCPAELAYGDNGAGELILPGATLQFEIELLDFKPSVSATTPKPAEKGGK